MKKIIISIITLLVLFSAISCRMISDQSSLSEESRSSESSDAGIATNELPERIEDDYSARNVHVVIDAVVDIGEVQPDQEVELGFSELLAEQITNVLVYNQYPDIEPYRGSNEYAEYDLIKAREGEELSLLHVMISTDGDFKYFEPINNINNEYGITGDGEYHDVFDQGYIADVIPDGMIITAEEAAMQVADFFEQFTIFTYEPYNVTAYNNQFEDNLGFYKVYLTPYYNGIPLLTKNGANINCPIMPEACISNTSIFSAQGFVVFDVVNTNHIEHLASFNDIYEDFKSRVTVLAEGDTITVSNVSLAYLPMTMANGNRLLVPAWCFDCIDKGVYADSGNMDGQSFEHEICLIYNAENGNFWDVYY